MIDESQLRADAAGLVRYVQAHHVYSHCRADVALTSSDFARRVRLLAGMSVRQFAAMLDVSPSFWSKVERGKEAMSAEMAGWLLAIVFRGDERETPCIEANSPTL